MVFALQLSGGELDLIKCFELIPGAPLTHIYKAFGVLEAFVSAKFRYLQHLRWRFKLGGGLGRSLLSYTGVPEGDPDSVFVIFCGFGHA